MTPQPDGARVTVSSTLIQNDFDASPILVDHAEGVWVVDRDGKRYLDGCSGSEVVSIGHGHPHVLAAMAEQAGRVAFTHRGAFRCEKTDELADALTRMTGYPGVWLVNSGSEAVEAAMQFALQYFRETGRPERHGFLSHELGYHGNTLGALSLSGHARRAVVEDLALDFPQLPAPYAYRRGEGLTEAAYAAELLARDRELFEAHAADLAGVVVEPVGGATLAATVPPDGYLQGLRALCDEFGVLMIADEVMSGLGRTGTTLAVDHWGVRPDVVAMGKGLGAGYSPMAGVLVGQRVLDAIAAGSRHVTGGHTYAGNPLSSAVGLAVLEVLESEGVIANAAAMGAYLAEGLDRLAAEHPLIGEVRGLGLMRGVEFVQDRATKRVDLPQGVIAGRVYAACMAHGLVVYPTSGGIVDAVLVTPPLVITREQVDYLLDALSAGIADVERELGLAPAARTA